MVAVKGSMGMCSERREGGIDFAQSIAMALDIRMYMIPIQKHRARISSKSFIIIGCNNHHRRESPRRARISTNIQPPRTPIA